MVTLISIVVGNRGRRSVKNTSLRDNRSLDVASDIGNNLLKRTRFRGKEDVSSRRLSGVRTVIVIERIEECNFFGEGVMREV